MSIAISCPLCYLIVRKGDTNAEVNNLKHESISTALEMQSAWPFRKPGNQSPSIRQSHLEKDVKTDKQAKCVGKWTVRKERIEPAEREVNQ